MTVSSVSVALLLPSWQDVITNSDTIPKNTPLNNSLFITVIYYLLSFIFYLIIPSAKP